MGRPRKAPEQRVNRATVDLPDAVPTAVVVPFGVPTPEPPKPSSTWLKQTKDEWAEVWKSALADHYQDQEHAPLRRCFDWRDKQNRVQRKAAALRKLAEDEPLVEGSKEQPVANPLFDVAAKLEAEAMAIESHIVALEDRYGLTPQKRMGLGLTREKGLNLAAQNAAIARALAEANGADDPRASGGNPPVVPT